MNHINLSYNLEFSELYRPTGLVKIDGLFVEFLAEADVGLYNRFVSARAAGLEGKAESNLLIALAPLVEDFLAGVFNIRAEVSKLQFAHNELGDLYTAKRLFVQRAAAKYLKNSSPRLEGGNISSPLPEGEVGVSQATNSRASENPPLNPLPQGGEITAVDAFELEYAQNVIKWMDANDVPNLTLAARYAEWAGNTEEGRARHADGVLFKKPQKLDFLNLVPLETFVKDGVTMMRLPPHEWRVREGFDLTDEGGTLRYALDHANYCIYCHNQGKDSCSKGMWEKEVRAPKKSPTNVNLAGCPLEEKISEMNAVKAAGFAIGALAIVVVDNPMCAATGHRICNDCMKSCVFQKQQPVDIPQVETRNLKDVLALPWGFEIYSLLTRWNPMNLQRPLPKPATGYKVLVAGLGPAGFTLAHHLMNDGHAVVGVDGLKIEPVAAEISGVDANGGRVEFKPIRDIEEIRERLSERSLAGFGGVAEYGITVRWDKNFLKIIRLLLERRAEFSMFGGVRFGSNITYDQAYALGFDHIALCMGAGKPTVVDMKNALARGVRTASDFLMALQLTGAAKADSIANLTLRLPVVVIGGGLTALDCSTESMAYYPVQVEKFLARYEALVADLGENAVREKWSEEEREIAEEFISHARQLRQAKSNPPPASPLERGEIKRGVAQLLNEWGGVTLAYRKTLQDAPSYRLNHEEVELGFQEGITFLGDATPLEVVLDKYGHASGVRVNVGGVERIIPAKTVLMAAGTSPNTVGAREDVRNFQLDGKYFQMIDENGVAQKPEWMAKPAKANVLMSLRQDGKAMSFFGDLHPDYAGNVVKAMGSAKQGYPVVSRVLSKVPPLRIETDFNKLLRARVYEVIRLTPNIIEVVIKAPLAARNFQPGQFYRLQNFESHALKNNSTTLALEGLALTGAWVDKERGLMGTIVLEMGGSSDLCSVLRIGEPVVLMGPTGMPTEILKNETVMLVGGGLGNAVLFSIGRALRENGCKVLYFAGYKKAADRYKIEEIEAASDVVIWACDEAADFTPGRADDRFFHGNIVAAIKAYASGKLGEMPIKTSDVAQIVTIGSDRMMAAVTAARHGVLKPYLKADHIGIGSINSPMQCMMKEICAQCLQRHVDAETGKEYFVYSCYNQDQKLDNVDWGFLNQRLKQNGVWEKLTGMWIEKCLMSPLAG